ncbi:MAG TPA: acyltransferase family protein [Fibrobacteria bacterium]|nr:acyltransferase family protein [Fibrobacteria bacterium]
MADRRTDIEGLRAVAVVAVVLFHAFPGVLPGGFVGVDVFFVISGFLITGILGSRLLEGTLSYRDFYARRVRRLAPALLAVLPAIAAAGWLVLFPREFGSLGRHIAAACVWLSNLVLWRESGYFEAAAETIPMLHFWSLAVEIQFYLGWPLVLALLWKFQRRWMLPAIVLAIAASFAAGVHLAAANPSMAYYLPISRFWELLAGAALAVPLGGGNDSAVPAWRKEAASTAGAFLLAVGFAVVDRNCTYPGWWALLPVCATVLLVGPGRGGWFHRMVLERPRLVWLGGISYPLYLWHWPILAFVRIEAGAAVSVPARLVAVSVAMVLAWLTWRWVERPLRSRPGPRVVGGLLTGIVCCGGLGLAVSSGRIPAREDRAEVVRIEEAKADWSFPGELVRVAGRTGYHGIDSRRSEVTQFLGDSHIQQYAGRIAKVATENAEGSNRVLMTSRGACPPIPGTTKPTDLGCGDAIDGFYAAAEDPGVRTVVVGACWNCYLAVSAPDAGGFLVRDSAGRFHPYASETGRRIALANLEDALRRLGKTRKVYLLLDNPGTIANDPFQRLRGGRLFALEVLPAPDSLAPAADQAGLRDHLLEMARRLGVEVLDPWEMLCDADRCLNALPDGTPVYKDDNHLRGSFLAERATFIDRVLTER